MIRLCYINQQVDNEGLVHFTTSTLIQKLDPSKDLVVVPSTDFLETCSSCAMFRADDAKYRYFLEFENQKAVVESSLVDLEKISKQKLRNIILINFDSMDPSIIRCLINKSKKTEIIGVSVEHTKYFKDLQLEVYLHKYNGFSNDQILVMMVLEHNCAPTLIEQCIDNIKFKSSNIHLKTVDHITDVLQYIK